MNESDRRSQDVQSWKQLYRAAVLETNMELVPRRILEARKAAGERAVHLIREAADGEPELQDLVYASVVLNELNRSFSPSDIQDPCSQPRRFNAWTTQEQAPLMLEDILFSYWG